MQKELQVAICEDDPTDAKKIKNCIKKTKITADCELFSSGESLLENFCTGRFDIVFMDIYMEGILGIDAAEQIRELDEDVILVFITTSLDHTLKSYRLGAIKYLEKPIQLKSVAEVMGFAQLKRESVSYITLLIGGQNQKVPLNTVYYFEQNNHAVTIFTTTECLRTSQTVKLLDIEKILPSPPFLRCHHSYIVNLRFVRAFNTELNVFAMKNGNNAYIRRPMLKKAEVAYKNFLYLASRRGEF